MSKLRVGGDEPGALELSGPIIVTGASGFIGSHLRRRLLDAGHDVVALRRPQSPPASVGRSLEVDYLNADSVRAVVNEIKPRFVFHVAGATNGITFEDFERANVTPTAHLAEALAAQDTFERFVLVSSLAARGPSPLDAPRTEDDEPTPVENYGKSKLAAEDALAKTELPYAIVEPGGVYGPRDAEYFEIFKLAARGWSIFFGNRNRKFSGIYVDDVVDLLLTCATHPAALGRRYFACDGEPLTWKQFGDVVAQSAGRRVRELDLPEFFVRVASFFGELATKVDGRPRLFNRNKAIMNAQDAWTCSPDRAANELNFRAKVPVAEGVAKTFAWYRQEKWL